MRYLSSLTPRKSGQLWNLMDPFDEMFKDVSAPVFSKNELGFSAVDIEEKEAAYLVTMDLPGMKEEEIKIDLAKNLLKISGERKRETKKEDGHYYERSYGAFSRTFNVPDNIDAEKIEAKYEHGVLKIEIPKAEINKEKTIKINVNSSKQLNG